MGLPAENANAANNLAKAAAAEAATSKVARQREVGAYVARFAAELRKLSTGAELDFLAYLIGMAEQEANLIVSTARDRD